MQLAETRAADPAPWRDSAVFKDVGTDSNPCLVYDLYTTETAVCLQMPIYAPLLSLRVGN